MAQPSNARQVGSSRTSPQPRGKTIPVLPPEDTEYLCSKICFCDCNAKLSASGQVLKQRCVSNSTRNECDAAHQVWRYKGEVGYNMKNSPPTPLMSMGPDGKGVMPPRPSAFPLGVAMRDGVFATRDLTSRPQKGLLRIPDVIIVKDMHNLSLEQANIEFVVEIKFPPDNWRPGQQQAYERIAGDPNRLKEMSPQTCHCPPCRQPERQPAPVILPQERLAEEKTEYLQMARAHNAARENHPIPELVPVMAEPIPLADYLKTGAKMVGLLALTIGAVYVGGPLLLTLLVVSTAATAQNNNPPKR